MTRRSLLALVVSALAVAALASCRRRRRPTRADAPAVATARLQVKSSGRSRYPTRGPVDAPVVLTLVSDLRDTMRLRYATAALRRYPKRVRLIWLSNIWPDQLEDATLALAAHRQGAFFRVRSEIARLRKAGGGWRRCAPDPLRMPTPIALDGRRLRLDLDRLDRDQRDPALARELIRQWRAARVLGLVRPARWQGADFLLVNGARLLPRRPGFTPASAAQRLLRARIEQQLAAARSLPATQRDEHHRLLARRAGRRAYLRYVIDGRSPTRAVAVAIDGALPGAARAALRGTLSRAVGLLDERVGVAVWEAAGGRIDHRRLGARLPPVVDKAAPAPQARPSAREPPLARLLRAVARSNAIAVDFDRYRRLIAVVDRWPARGRMRAAVEQLRPAALRPPAGHHPRAEQARPGEMERLSGLAPIVTNEEALADRLLSELARPGRGLRGRRADRAVGRRWPENSAMVRPPQKSSEQGSDERAERYRHHRRDRRRG